MTTRGLPPSSRWHFPLEMLHQFVRLRHFAACSISIFSLALAEVSAAEAAKIVFDLPAESAESSLRRFSAQSGHEVLFATQVATNVRANAVKGKLSAREALDRLLAGTELVATQDAKTGAFTVSRASDPNVQRADAAGSVRPVALAKNDAANRRTNAGTGAITGQVFNPNTGEFLENARVAIEGSSRETFTNNVGQYLLSEVPAGPVKLRTFYTGLAVQIAEVTVMPGQTVRRDFDLLGFDQKPNDGPVKLSKFVVSTSKQMDGAAIAINEQRFAPNMREVITADEFGAVADSRIEEVLKFIPGVSVDIDQNYLENAVSLGGVQSANVPLTVDGFNLASAVDPSGRNAQLSNVSTNNISRIEVLYSPTPESPGMALAGSINMVPRSAFERSKPIFNGNAFVLMRPDSADLHKTPGPGPFKTRKVHPGFDFSYIVPVNSRFGFSLSAGTSTTYEPIQMARGMWRGGNVATNGVAFPDTTPDKPYLTDYFADNLPRDTTRSSLGLTLDFKLTDRDRVSFSAQGALFRSRKENRRMTFQLGRVLPGDFGETFTHGAVGAGRINLSNAYSEIEGKYYMPSLRYWHVGPVWRGDAGIAMSHSTSYVPKDVDRGYFHANQFTRTNLTLSFDDIAWPTPGRVTARDGTTGAPVDIFDANNYTIVSVSGNTDPENASTGTRDLQRSAYANVGRQFHGRIPLTLKGGLDIRHSARDYRGDLSSEAKYNFVGANGVPTTVPAGGDDGAGILLNGDFREPLFGFPRIAWPSSRKMYDLFSAHPEYFTYQEEATYRSVVRASKFAEEIISSAYIRGDVQLFGRLNLVGGVRAEQTNVQGEGPLTDVTLNYQRDAQGNPIRGANGRILLITSNPVEIARRTFLDRQTHVEKEYLRFFPSLNAAFNLRENLILRGAYFESIGRPSFLQYSSGLNLPDLDAVQTSANYRIRVNNAGIKAWSAKTYKLKLEYYFQRVGLVSISAFRRDTINFFGDTTFAVTPEFLALYGLDPDEYGSFEVTTNYNIPGTIRMEGMDFNYKQALTFLPNWARGVQVFANGNMEKKIGNSTGDFNGVTRSLNWGASLSREKYNVRANFNYRIVHRADLVVGRSIGPETYFFTDKRLYVDLNAEYNVSRHFTVFANVRNLNNRPTTYGVAGPLTPDYARLNWRSDFDALWTFGVKSTF